jgi:hypothetical protein
MSELVEARSLGLGSMSDWIRTMTEWTSLQHAYGPAGDIPALLAAAENSGAKFGPAWNDVWSRLCHQGTTYTASYAALPLLADMAERHAPAGYVAALDLAAAILASTDGPTDPVLRRQQHADTLRRLHDLAYRNLPLAEGDTEFVYGLQALMAFEDGGVWQRHLNHVADGELPLECPNCGELLILNLDGPEYTLASYTDGSIPPTPVRPYEPPMVHSKDAWWRFRGISEELRSSPKSGTSSVVPLVRAATRSSILRTPSPDVRTNAIICRCDARSVVHSAPVSVADDHSAGQTLSAARSFVVIALLSRTRR